MISIFFIFPRIGYRTLAKGAISKCFDLEFLLVELYRCKSMQLLNTLFINSSYKYISPEKEKNREGLVASVYTPE